MKTSIIAFAIVFSGMLIRAQEGTEYNQDTVWLKSGKVIPCKISSGNPGENVLTLKYYDENGILIYEPMPFELVKTYVISPEKKDPILPDSLETIKAYLGFGFGFPSNGGIGFTLILKNNFGLSISYKHTSFDQQKESNFGSVSNVPGDQLSVFSLCVVREFPFANNKRIRIGLEAGPSLVKYEKVEQIDRYYGYFGPYYKAQTSDHSSGGLSLRAKLEFPLTLAFGFEIALYSNINKYKSFIGFEFYLTLGKVRDRIKPKS